jgi:hypothetical protein
VPLDLVEELLDPQPAERRDSSARRPGLSGHTAPLLGVAGNLPYEIYIKVEKMD